jgi:hypothetical protein
MTPTLVVTLLVILAVTVVLAFALREWTVKAPAVIVIYGAVFGLLVAGGGLYTRLTAQRVYDQCVSAVTRSDGNRAYQLFLITLIDRELPAAGLGAELRTVLDLQLPERSLAECVEP